MGEVIFENNDVYGDGVNIASRIEPLAEPNQILVSETVHNNIQNKSGIISNQIGERELKGVEKALLIYQAEVHDEFLTPRIKEEKKRVVNPLLIALAVFLLIVIGLAGYWIGLNSTDAPRIDPVIRYNIEIEATLTRTGRHSLAFSPDGTYLCYVSGGQLMLKSMDDPGSDIIVKGASDPREPVFSPDGKWIAFDDVSNNALVKIPVTGGNTARICALENGTRGMLWNEDVIFFGTFDGIFRVDANGGIPEKIYQNTNEFLILNVQILPDKETVLLHQLFPESGRSCVAMARVGSSDEPLTLIEGGMDPRFLSSGHIAFIKDETLQIVKFDPGSNRIIGSPKVIVSDRINIRNVGQFAFNNHGTLVFWTGNKNDNEKRNLVWVNFSGKIETISKEPSLIMSPKISGDGRLIAVDQIVEVRSYEIVMYDPILGTATDFVSEQSAITPVWSSDYTFITYFQFDEPQGVYMKPVDHSYAPKLLFESNEIIHLGNWSKNGRYLVFRSPKGAGYYDSNDGSTHFLNFINEGEGVEVFFPILSPDGKWLAYTSDDNQNNDHVYVVPFPGPGRAHRISVDEGHAPVWDPEMRYIYFISQGDSGINISRASIETNPQFSSSKPDILFYGNYTSRYQFENADLFQFGNTGMFDIHPDGDRFLMQKGIESGPESDQSELLLKVVVNWPELIK
jgi:Tol biopolymer transport system component